MSDELIPLVPLIRRFAYSLTGTVADADDLLQSTLERLLSRPMPADVALTQWALRVCKNLWIDEYRARRVRQLAAQSPELSDPQLVDGERAVHSQIALDEVQAAMAELPDEQRAILALVAVQGQSYREVADTLGIPMGTVMSRLARARSAICQQLNLDSRRQA